MARILLSCHQFFPRFYTGTETLVLEVADELKRRGHIVEILTTEPILPGDQSPNRTNLSRSYYKGHKVWKICSPNVIDSIDRYERELKDSRLVEAFYYVVNRFKPDISHVFHLMRLTSSWVDILKERGIKTFFTATDFWFLCPTYQLIRYNGELCEGPDSLSCFSCQIGEQITGMPKVPLKLKMGAKFPKLATIANIHANKLERLLDARASLYRKTIKSFEGVIFSNPFMQDIFHKNGFHGKKEYVLSFPIPKRSEQVSKLEFPPVNERIKIAFIGTLNPTKGPQVLIEACKQINNRSDIEVQIWGDTPNKNFLTKIKKQASEIPWIKFCGTFPQETFPEILKDIHIVVIPSTWYENTPLTGLTALAAKKVLVVSNLGGLSSLVSSGHTGYTFPAGDHLSLAEVLLSLINDRNKLLEISSSTRTMETVQGYVDKIIEIYGLN